MTLPMIVVSTGYNVPLEWEKNCRDSVRAQSHRAKHLYFDAAMLPPVRGEPVPSLAFIGGVAAMVSPETVIVWLDGDDWLAHSDALSIVAGAHDDGAWLTYGSYAVWHEGTIEPSPEHPREYGYSQCRRDRWYASHLKTFRAGLFNMIPREYYSRENTELCALCTDQAVMWSMLELCGDGYHRVWRCPSVLVTYNATNPRSVHNAPYPRRQAANRESERLRKLPPLERLVRAPFLEAL